MDIKQCACGKTPRKFMVHTYQADRNYAFASPRCCLDWQLMFDTTGLADIDGEQAFKRIVKEWNELERCF